MYQPCNTCIHSKVNNGGTWCKYSPKINDTPDACRNDSHYESIYTIEPTIVLGSCYYAPPKNDEMKETEPIVFTVGE